MKLKNKKAGFMILKGTVWPYDIVVCIGTTREEILEYMDRRFINALTDKDKESLEMTGHGRAVRLENKAYILWTKEYPDTPERVGYLVHEIFHVCDLMLRAAGMTLSDDSDEAFAYLIDWVTCKIFGGFEILGKESHQK